MSYGQNLSATSGDPPEFAAQKFFEISASVHRTNINLQQTEQNLLEIYPPPLLFLKLFKLLI